MFFAGHQSNFMHIKTAQKEICAKVSINYAKCANLSYVLINSAQKCSKRFCTALFQYANQGALILTSCTSLSSMFLWVWKTSATHILLEKCFLLRTSKSFPLFLDVLKLILCSKHLHWITWVIFLLWFSEKNTFEWRVTRLL